MNGKAIFLLVSAMMMSSSARSATFESHDLYPLNNPGNGFTQVFPTGFHPAADGVVGGQRRTR